jgi:hypothetical protein
MREQCARKKKMTVVEWSKQLLPPVFLLSLYGKSLAHPSHTL